LCHNALLCRHLAIFQIEDVFLHFGNFYAQIKLNRECAITRLLLVGKKHGIINSVKSELNRLVEHGFWISDGLRKEALREAEEIE
jgi:hypothetical protein